MQGGHRRVRAHADLLRQHRGGEPTVRSDFWELVEYATDHHVGVKFSTNGSRITDEVARRLAASDYVDVQISLDGATAAVNDAVRGAGSYATAITAMDRLADAGFVGFKLSVVVTRHNVDQLDDFKAAGRPVRCPAPADPAPTLRPGRRRVGRAPSRPPTSSAILYDWLLAHGEDVLTGDSFFHLAGYGESLPGLNLCGAGRVVCLVDPVGDVYACPFAIHDEFLAGNVRSPGGFAEVWRHSDLFTELRRPQSAGACASCGHYDSCRGGCMAAKFFTGLPLDGPDPECVLGHGEQRAGRPGRGPAAQAVARPLAPCAASGGSVADRGRPDRGRRSSGPARPTSRPGLRREPAGRASSPAARAT